MSSIRLLVLGVVRFAQPVHGYDVRRELQGWHLDGWVNVQPGSIYSALKTLERDGFIATASTDHAVMPNRPERTEYVMTIEGEKQFTKLLRTSWWQVERGAEPFFPAMCFLTAMTRDELLASLQARLSQQEAQVAELRFIRASIRDGHRRLIGLDLDLEVRRVDTHHQVACFTDEWGQRREEGS